MTVNISLGELRTRLVLEEANRTGDGGGGSDVIWNTVDEVWAAVRPSGGGEGFQSDRVAGRLSHTIFIRYRGDVKPEMRFREGTRVYDIRAVFDPDRRRHWLRCLAQERDL